jgi:hypothetical protein
MLSPILCPEYPTNLLVSQGMDGDSGSKICIALDMESDTAVTFAERYTGERFSPDSEYVSASIEDMLNLHNGVFNVNLSNIFSKEVKLHPPVTYRNELYLPEGTTYLLPMLFPFGTVNFLFSVYSRPKAA